LVIANTLLEVRGAVDSGPSVLVEFGAPWCVPCTRFLPHFERFAAKHPEIICVKVDVDVDPAVVSEYGIQSVPQVWLYENGVKVKEIPDHARTVIKLENELNLN
jgi:thioredoxin-like negative regulator of GroEL